MKGKELIETLIAATGLPPHLVREEIYLQLKDSGISPDDVNLDHLRKVMVKFLQKGIIEAKKEHSKVS